jgi:hypothetical protein
MNLEQIKAAVDAGQTVHWANPRYCVIKDSLNQYLVTCQMGSTIGLTHLDGVTLNGEEAQFYIPTRWVYEFSTRFFFVPLFMGGADNPDEARRKLIEVCLKKASAATDEDLATDLTHLAEDMNLERGPFKLTCGDYSFEVREQLPITS